MRSRGNGAADQVAHAAPAPDVAACPLSAAAKAPAPERESVQKAQAEQAKLNETLTLRRQQYKEKNQHYLDLKALCEREATIKDLELSRPA
jgi:hypothetical protein